MLTPPILPMLAKAQNDIPRGDGWLYEPKWDGFRAIVFVGGDQIHIGSRKGQPLQRYFPELLPHITAALDQPCVVDGEIVVPSAKGLDFDALQQRIHPAASRVAMLAEATPAHLILFDILALGERDLRDERLDTRRETLEQVLRGNDSIALTPQTDDADTAQMWFTRYEGAGLDGVVAKRADQRYRSDQRVMIKVKHLRTVDCVVGGYRVHKDGKGVGSLLLGLYTEDAVLHFVGHTSSFDAAERRALLDRLRPLEGGTSYGEGRTPGGPSRWTGSKDLSWVPLRPELVCEVQFDHLQGTRFRHASRLLRWRPDKAPSACTFDQLEPPAPFDLADVLATEAASG
ncbi:MAG TPA: ATP-dependent DNA ligase [Candidatus Dormibacteraeota bacterium]|jgi:ATP-dependent DNA ligase|nr:ATP-dependent DNA ligase [Candidatus Dormibacteraeota bacterium]